MDQSLSNDIVPAKTYLEYSNGSDKRRWKVSYGFSKEAEFYLTDEEKNYFVSQIKRGALGVEVGSLFLSSKFMFICPVADQLTDQQKKLKNMFGEK